MERLQKILARAGVASQREAERWIVEGRVSVNGTIVRKLGSQADPFKDSIKVDGKRIKTGAAPLYFAFYKPLGVIITVNDPQHRPDLTEFVAPLGAKRRVFPVGRLDFNSEGLLFLTNDGEFARRLTHPRFGVHKKYLATVDGKVAPEMLRRFTEGLWYEGERFQAQKTKLVSSGQSQSVVELDLAEG